MDHTASRNYFGIDPAIRNTGLAVIQETGDDKPEIHFETFTTHEDGILRLKEIALRLQWFTVEHGYHSGSNVVCMEGASHHSKNRTNDIGEMRGAVILTLLHLELDPIIIPPKRLKKFATGNGDASKQQMVNAAIKFWDVIPNTDDEADALWLATLAWGLNENPRMKRFQLELLKTIKKERTFP